MSSPAETAEAFKRLARDVRKVETAGVRGAAKVVKTSIEASLHSTKFAGGLSHMGKGGVKLSLGTKVRTDLATVTAKPAGPWAIVEDGAKAHPIRARRGNPTQVLKFPDGGFATGTVQHPGMKGAKPFDKGVTHADPLIPSAFAEALDKSLARF